MCLFKKKKPKVIIKTKFHMGDYIRFRLRGELCTGWIYEIYAKEGQETVYDVQIGGQCPAIIYGVKESELTLIEAKKD